MWKSMEFWGPLAAGHSREEDVWRALGSREDLPLARFAEAAEVAQAILYLASDDAALVTGAELIVGGGGEV
jgi:NAD(P)-dependent dehydrogenase (short-subunit alcohol dehydrogenase family)